LRDFAVGGLIGFCACIALVSMWTPGLNRELEENLEIAQKNLQTCIEIPLPDCNDTTIRSRVTWLESAFANYLHTTRSYDSLHQAHDGYLPGKHLQLRGEHQSLRGRKKSKGAK